MPQTEIRLRHFLFADDKPARSRKRIKSFGHRMEQETANNPAATENLPLCLEYPCIYCVRQALETAWFLAFLGGLSARYAI